MPLLYKCNARNAVAARRAGFALARVADEAVINPRQFDLSIRPLRQLRRKLSQARRAGLTTRRAVCLPRADMARVDAQWCARQEAARGLTMGRFDHGYLSHHLVFLAWQGEHLMGFATFHVTAHETCLDLMRSADDAPTGTMHALIAAAIDHAAANGRTRLSLAAIPASPRDARPIERYLRRLLFRASNGPGLARFKASFAPRFEPLYMAAPDRAALVLGAIDLALAVRNAPAPHDLDEEFAIAPQPQM